MNRKWIALSLIGSAFLLGGCVKASTPLALEKWQYEKGHPTKDIKITMEFNIN